MYPSLCMQVYLQRYAAAYLLTGKCEAVGFFKEANVEHQLPGRCYASHFRAYLKPGVTGEI